MLNSPLNPHTGLVLNGIRRDTDVYDAVWFEALFEAIDHLHDQVCDASAEATSPLAPDDLVGWLEDIIYTAQETIVEIRAKHPKTGVTTVKGSAYN